MASNRKQVIAKFCRQEMVRLGHGSALGLPMVAQANIIAAAHGYTPNCTTKAGARAFLERLSGEAPLVIPPPEHVKERTRRKIAQAKESEGLLTRLIQGENAPPSESQWVNSSEFLQSYEWRSLRMKVLTAYKATCMCCGATRNDGIKLHVDHIKPRRLFPHLALEFANLQILCEACNHGKGNWDQTDWRSV